ncbi:MAG: hypothetical protein SFX73_39030 [Kofleriaceae bacterium]|nr:hypothetical protein [Kofleriaceae bacterium]
MLRLALLAVLLGGCPGDAPAPVEPRGQRCTLFEDVRKKTPPGGLPIALDVPGGWKRIDDGDGGCRFASATAGVSVNLEPCGTDPCTLKLEGGRVRATTHRKVAGQTLRTNTLRIQDAETGYIVACKAFVQGAQISAELEAELKRGIAVCDSLALLPVKPRRSQPTAW